jgi:C-terminal processing protease CtpA/Prc
MHLDRKAYAEIIEPLAEALNDNYVFPDIAKEMAEMLQLKLSKNEYENIPSAEALCEKLTSDLREISKDKHVKLKYSQRENSLDRKINESEQKKAYLLRSKADNYGFYKVNRLPGNIGYIDLREFHNSKAAAETGANAMNLVANTEALIFDLRNNGGGDPNMVAFLTSYLFDSEPFHLNSFYYRPDDDYRQFWTMPVVTGKRYIDKPVYILISNQTFSGAEEFSYNLQHLKRAAIIGETSAGGANPGYIHQLTKHVSAFIPNGRAINPITKTNWEGTGVKPDIETSKEESFGTAYKKALHHVLDQYEDNINYWSLAEEAQKELAKMQQKIPTA